MFGFLINLPIVSYFETGTQLTPNHGHAAMMGVFGMLGLALMVFVLRETVRRLPLDSDGEVCQVRLLGSQRWPRDDGPFQPFPSGVLQVRDVLVHGYWHARSLDYLGGGCRA